jgi:predicted dehydrogenase
MNELEPINVGVVGCGYWGPNLIRNFRTLPGVRVRAMCDTNPQRLEHVRKLYPEVQAYTVFDQMLETPGLDAVAIATPLRLHYPMAKASLEAGKHTLIEKPMASSVAQCQELIALAERKHLVLMVGHTYLYSEALRRVKALVEWDEVGSILYVSCRRLNLGLFQQDINVFWDLAPHDLSILRYLLAEWPTAISCTGKAHFQDGIEDVTATSLCYAGNRFATLHHSWLDPKKVRDITIVGTKKMIIYDDVAPVDKIQVYDVRVERPAHYDSFAEFQYAYHYGDTRIIRVIQEEPLKVQCAHFVQCIRTGTQPITSGRDGLEVVGILEAASASLRQNGAMVPLPLDPPAQPLSSPAAAPSLPHSVAWSRP